MSRKQAAPIPYPGNPQRDLVTESPNTCPTCGGPWRAAKRVCRKCGQPIGRAERWRLIPAGPGLFAIEHREPCGYTPAGPRVSNTAARDQSRTIKQLCDRLEEINVAAHMHSDHEKNLAEVRALSAGFMQVPGDPPWKRDDDVTFDLLHLVADGAKVPRSAISNWSDAQVKEAEAWAGAIHLRASDNSGVRIPPTPAHVQFWIDTEPEPDDCAP